MRYLGNKESLMDNIKLLLNEKNLLNQRYVFFDAFCGTGTVSDGLKGIYDLIINDNLQFATTFSKGRILASECKFEKLGFNPISFFNGNKETFIGFFSKNYSPKLSNRMYFSDYNAGRIDFFRNTIEEWYDNKYINDDEYSYLLGCLLESISRVANIAGVYGAYLKKWDPRAVKEIIFLPIESSSCDNTPVILESYNKNLIDIIADVKCDILYLDPPYTKNKYSVQYHLIETLIRNDNPKLKGLTGTRDLFWVSQAWSTPNAVEIEFENVIANTTAKYILMSYSSAGIMSKEYILNVLRRYCEEETIDFKEIKYKKYRNSKTYTTDDNFEYLIYAVKKEKSKVSFHCPLNYMGGKTNVIDYIKPELTGKKQLVDLMGGGFNVGINGAGFEKIIYNDINHIVRDILIMFKNENTKKILDKIEKIIKKYSLGKHKKDEYIIYRQDYNSKYRFRQDYSIYLYTLILFGFQQQLRFNSNYEFNNPIGESGYNESIKEKIVSFSRRIRELNTEFYSIDFEKLLALINADTLVYIDPPYLITLGSYNDGKRGFNGWNVNEEKRLLSFIDKLIEKGAKIVISNILQYKGNTNIFLEKWINTNNPKVINITIRGRKEVLLVYEG